MTYQIDQLDLASVERQQFLEAYADNLTLLLDNLDAIAGELDQVGEYQAASFFTGIARAVSAFAAGHYPMARCLSRCASREAGGHDCGAELDVQRYLP